jgi:hypothetical protein
MDFVEFPKIYRLSREIVITEKIDGTNGCIAISDDGTEMQVGSRSRWLMWDADNFGFHAWAQAHKDELLTLGPGRHYGEWWGSGIQRRYGLNEKRFSLFNVSLWNESRPACCGVVPILYRGEFRTEVIDSVLANLAANGSVAAPGFMKPEGVVIFHTQGNVAFKKTIEKDAEHKGPQTGGGK